MDIDKATTYCFQTVNADASLGNTVIGVLFRQNTAIMLAGSQRLAVYADLCL